MKKLFFSLKLPALLIVLLAGFAIQCTIPLNNPQPNSQIAPQTKTEPFSVNKSPLPEPTGFVNDYVGVIDAATKQRLEKRLTQLKAQTNPQVEIGVAIVETTGNRDITDYSLAVARGWGIGSKEDDNPSALLFIAVNDRKYFTQVSKDLQDELPDGIVGQLQRQYLVPAFKQQNYGKGIEDTIEAYIRTIEGKQTTEATPPVSRTIEPNRPERSQSAGFGLCNTMFCLIILFILLILIFSRSGRSRTSRNDRNRWGGGGGFGSGGGALPWVIGSILASSMSNRGSSSSDWGGGSSDWGGSSGGWGGFGGGGDFDGGGAGGSW